MYLEQTIIINIILLVFGALHFNGCTVVGGSKLNVKMQLDIHVSDKNHTNATTFDYK